MSVIKKLAGQTAVYGLTSLARLIYTIILVPLQSRELSITENGSISFYFGWMAFANIIMMYGLETAFFRYAGKAENAEKVFSTAAKMILVSSLLIFSILILFAKYIYIWAELPGSSDLIILLSWVLLFDALCALPFARLRFNNQASRFAVARILNIVINILLNLFFLWYCPRNTDIAWVRNIYNPEMKIQYVFAANILGSFVSVLLTIDQWKGVFTEKFNKKLAEQLLKYGIPVLLTGLVGMMNETLDRAVLKYLLPENEAMYQTGIYGTCYKLAIIMSIFVQAFRYASEPLFFSLAEKGDAKQIYAKVMDWFVPACALVFLGMTMGINVAKQVIDEKFWVGLHIVPILLLANWFLGIYINISIWFKVSDRPIAGTWISIGGAIITLAGLFIFVPVYGYTSAAWTTLAAYFFMMITGYFSGRKYYKIPYNVIKNVGVIVGTIAIYIVWKITNG